MKSTVTLRSNRDFIRVYKRGRYLPGKYCVLHYMKNGRDHNRLGITTSRKVRGSVQRNRIRRLIRESYRLNEAGPKTGYDIVILGRETASKIGFDKMARDIIYLLKKAGIWSAG